VHNSLDVKERDDHSLDIAYHLSGPFGLGDVGLFSLKDYCFFLRVVTVNPSLITSDDSAQESFIIGGELTKFSAEFDPLLFVVSCQVPGHNFPATRCMHNSSDRTGWHVHNIGF
jgi:hypothetical protein